MTYCADHYGHYRLLYFFLPCEPTGQVLSTEHAWPSHPTNPVPLLRLQVTHGKGTTAGDLGSSLKKTDTPVAKKKAAAAAADGGDADSPTAMTGTAKPKPALGGAPKGGGGPKIYTCYMCGQGFSGSSLGIHQPKCQQKWLAEQAAKPAGDLQTCLILIMLAYAKPLSQ